MYRRITASCIILFILINGFKNETLKQTGFLGKSVTLPSGVNETGKFTTIEWSILAKNNTYIARFSGGNVKYYQQQRDRLKLDTTTGDLEIRDLRREDIGTYTVHVRKSDVIQWNNKVKLSVQEKLPEPSITVTNRKIEYGMCKILLTCSVKSETTTITYGPEGFPHGCEFKPLRYATTGREAEAWCSPIQDVNITCTASDSVSTTASTVRTGCSRTDPVFICSAGCGIMCFFGGVIITAAVCIVLYIKCDARSGFVRTPWARLRERLPRRCRYILARSEEAPRTSHEPTTPESAVSEAEPGASSDEVIVPVTMDGTAPQSQRQDPAPRTSHEPTTPESAVSEAEPGASSDEVIVPVTMDGTDKDNRRTST